MHRSAILLSAVAASACVWLSVAAPAARGEPRFSVSIDAAAQKKWGLRYPATYVFEVSGVSAGVGLWSLVLGLGSWVLGFGMGTRR